MDTSLWGENTVERKWRFRSRTRLEEGHLVLIGAYKGMLIKMVNNNFRSFLYAFNLDLRESARAAKSNQWNRKLHSTQIRLGGPDIITSSQS